MFHVNYSFLGGRDKSAYYKEYVDVFYLWECNNYGGTDPTFKNTFIEILKAGLIAQPNCVGNAGQDNFSYLFCSIYCMLILMEYYQ